MLPATLTLAISALLRNKMRSLLTMLGIVIGVAAVVMMQAMGRGATAYVGDAISGLGSNMLIVIPGTVKGMQQSSLGVPLFTAADLEAVRRLAHDVALVSAAGQRVSRAVAGPYNRSVTTSGVTPEYFAIRAWGVARGRLLTQVDERRASTVCLIGQTVADALFPGQDPLSRELRVHQIPCRVVGVMEIKGASAFGMDQDDVIFMPYSTFSRRIMGSDRVPVFMASAKGPELIEDAKAQITRILQHRRHIPQGEEDNFAVRDPRELQALLQSVTGVLTMLLAGVAAVSLVVGGIGIMNIMLVSVTERTREIGVRLAIGARGSDVLTQFLVEAVALSALGGLIGIGLGLLGAMGAARAIHVPFVVPGLAMPIAFGVSVLVGVTFGVFPARKAAKMNPLAALRYE
ncbi:MAG TPA: ABC transporter permease [Polyangiaceae bacterium]|nr:ABC transporter permease [Polyangiaceae bacterium]